MASRIENVVNTPLSKGETEYSFSAPRGSSKIQVVLDRTRFEDLLPLKDRDGNIKDVCVVRLYSGTNYIGGASWAGGRIGPPHPNKRPGVRMLWSYGMWNLPKGANRIRMVVRAIEDFNCRFDVDFF